MSWGLRHVFLLFWSLPLGRGPPWGASATSLTLLVSPRSREEPASYSGLGRLRVQPRPQQRFRDCSSESSLILLLMPPRTASLPLGVPAQPGPTGFGKYQFLGPDPEPLMRHRQEHPWKEACHGRPAAGRPWERAGLAGLSGRGLCRGQPVAGEVHPGSGPSPALSHGAGRGWACWGQEPDHVGWPCHAPAPWPCGGFAVSQLRLRRPAKEGPRGPREGQGPP